MKMQIIGIFDRKAQVFISMEPTSNIAVATRQFQDVINRGGDNPMSKWPGDFSLWHLGEFDTETGFVQALIKGKVFKKVLVIEGESLKDTNTERVTN